MHRHILISGSTALDRILSYKQDEVTAAKTLTPLSDLDAQARQAAAPREALQRLRQRAFESHHTL